MKKMYALKEVGSDKFYRNGTYDLVENIHDSDLRSYTSTEAEMWKDEVNWQCQDDDNSSSHMGQRPDFLHFELVEF